jgi:hypothetical protein
MVCDSRDPRLGVASKKKEHYNQGKGMKRFEKEYKGGSITKDKGNKLCVLGVERSTAHYAT